MKLFRDTETGAIIEEINLLAEFIELAANGETDSKTFAEYVGNCTDKNGTLEVITP